MTLWLGWTGELSYYLHPRYTVFAVVMASIGVLACLLSLALSGRPSRVGSTVAKEPLAMIAPGHDHGHDHNHDHDEQPSGLLGRSARGASAVLSLGALCALVLLPPATLGTVTLENRSLNQASVGDTQAAFDLAQSGAEGTFLAFTVREWVGVLQQTQDPAFFQGKPVNLVGFVAEDPDNPDVFYLTRFLVSHCSVDAQPIAVPVSLPGWEATFGTEEWVQVSGEFVANPNPEGTHTLVVKPRDVVPTEKPDEPYLF